MKINKLELGEPQHCKNVTVFPLLVRRSGKQNYQLLGGAIECGSATVEEMSDGGTVPQLIIYNDSSTPVLAIGGEMLKGGQQNRGASEIAGLRCRLP